MEVVYKYPLVVTDRQLVTMPKEAKLMSVQVQNGTPCLWALVNPENPTSVILKSKDFYTEKDKTRNWFKINYIIA